MFNNPENGNYHHIPSNASPYNHEKLQKRSQQSIHLAPACYPLTWLNVLQQNIWQSCATIELITGPLHLFVVVYLFASSRSWLDRLAANCCWSSWLALPLTHFLLISLSLTVRDNSTRVPGPICEDLTVNQTGSSKHQPNESRVFLAVLTAFNCART